MTSATHTHKDDEAEFHGTQSSITGVALYGYEVEGRGDILNFELVHVDCDGLKLTRSQIETVVGTASLEHIEAIAGDIVATQWSAGEMRAA